TVDYQKTVNTGSTWQLVDFTFTTGSLASAQNFSFNSCGTNNATDVRLDNFELYNISSLSALETVGVENQNIYFEGNSLVADFELTQPSEVGLSIFNAQGMLLKKINGNYDAGKNHKVMNVNLTSGVYLVKMNFNGQVVTKKLIK
ncbi:MAG TPA: T9SS type A sorting domain-containing protein, partial [Paludibacter sp.]